MLLCYEAFLSVHDAVKNYDLKQFIFIDKCRQIYKNKIFNIFCESC